MYSLVMKSRLSFVTKKPRTYKTWHFWAPRLTGVMAEVYVSAPGKESFSKLKRPPRIYLDIRYGSARRLFLVPENVGVGLVGEGHNLFFFRTFLHSQKKYLKSFINSLALNLLGFVSCFKVFLRVRGLGYRVYVKDEGRQIQFKLGYSHLAVHRFKFGIIATQLGVKERMFSLEGHSWLMLTTMAMRLQRLKKIDVYRGKGIFKKFYRYKVRQSRKKK